MVSRSLYSHDAMKRMFQCTSQEVAERTTNFWPGATILFVFPQQIYTLTNELQDSAVITRNSVYIGAGISAGLALVLIFGVLILKCKSFDVVCLSLC